MAKADASAIAKLLKRKVAMNLALDALEEADKVCDWTTRKYVRAAIRLLEEAL